MQNTNPENKIIWIDNLRVVATIAVILLHISSSPLPQFGAISPFSWWVGNIYDSTVRFCVPVFVMITGALLLPQKYEINYFLKKKLLRLILPLAFWSFIYITFSLSVKYIHGERIAFLEIVQYIFVSIQKGSSYHFWYIYMIIGIYLFIPIIGKWAQNCLDKEILYFLAIWLFTIFLNQPIISKFKPGIDFTYFTGYLGYLILGYYLSRKSFNNQVKASIISIIIIALGIVITILGTYIGSNHKGAFYDPFYNYLSPNVLIVSIGVFILFKNEYNYNTKYFKISNFISRYSYGIYLVHIIVISLLYKLGLYWNSLNPIIGIPLTTVLCLVISGGIIYLINKLPFGKYISG
jgi:surface polysaccharide O-acyltransferase-like enzyme